jgi:hypothetical protein
MKFKLYDENSGNGYDGDVEFWQYSSYEIKDFNQAIQKWEEFFKSKNRIEII